MKTSLLFSSFIVCILWTTNLTGQPSGPGKDRMPVAAGSFYPSDVQNLKSQLEFFLTNADDTSVEKDIAAVIVPHAGYIFSGPVAASAYAKIDPGKSFERIFIIGSSHHVLLNGASVYSLGDYQTPLGKVEVDTELAGRLIKQSKLIEFNPAAHEKEHSIEVQLPFLQYHLKKPFKIVPIVIGTQSDETCQELAEILAPYLTPENLFVISSDFSHYPSYANATKTDRATGIAIAANSPSRFIETILTNEEKKTPGLATSCCGWSSVLTLLYLTSARDDIQVKHVKYMNSGDSPYGDPDRVVGYHSFLFIRGKETGNTGEYALTANEKKVLLDIARESIELSLQKKTLPEINVSELSSSLKAQCGAFVTLNKNDQLRGCIGRFMPDQPLYLVVREMALAAAFRDTRFQPVKQSEMKDIDIEISVLTPLKKIQSINDFTLGKQGIYMVKGDRSGTFLPQVAEMTRWSKEEFLGHCAQDKAGIGWDGWKSADLYTYEALVFDEKQLLSEEK